MTQHFYVVCEDYVGSEPSEAAAVAMAARLDAGHALCAGTHAVITAASPTAARDAYYRKVRATLAAVPSP